MNVVKNLSRKGLLLYLAIQALVQFNKNCCAIKLKYEQFKKYMPNFDLSKVSFYRAIKELVEADVLAKSNETSIYWFNFYLFYCGSRNNLIQHYNNAIRALGYLEEESDGKADK